MTRHPLTASAVLRRTLDAAAETAADSRRSSCPRGSPLPVEPQAGGGGVGVETVLPQPPRRSASHCLFGAELHFPEGHGATPPVPGEEPARRGGLEPASCFPSPRPSHRNSGCRQPVLPLALRALHVVREHRLLKRSPPAPSGETRLPHRKRDTGCDVTAAKAPSLPEGTVSRRSSPTDGASRQ